MKRISKITVMLLAAASLVLAACQKEEEELDHISFEELQLDPGKGYWNGGEKSAAGFTSGNARFPIYWDDTYGPYWEGFSYTDHTDTKTAGIENQYSSYAGGGAGNSSQYAVFYMGFYGTDTLSFMRPEQIDRMSVSNSTYTALAMKNGDLFTKKFGGEDGTDPDWFSLVIEGISSSGDPTGSIEIAMADFRDPGTETDYISNAWTTIPMESLGTVQKLVFSFASSDTAFGFINVPTYICIDDIVGTLK